MRRMRTPYHVYRVAAGTFYSFRITAWAETWTEFDPTGTESSSRGAVKAQFESETIIRETPARPHRPPASRCS